MRLSARGLPPSSQWCVLPDTCAAWHIPRPGNTCSSCLYLLVGCSPFWHTQDFMFLESSAPGCRLRRLPLWSLKSVNFTFLFFLVKAAGIQKFKLVLISTSQQHVMPSTSYMLFNWLLNWLHDTTISTNCSSTALSMAAIHFVDWRWTGVENQALLH